MFNILKGNILKLEIYLNETIYYVYI